MPIMGQAATGGDNEMHIETAAHDPDDTDWLNYKVTDLRLDFTGLLQKAQEVHMLALAKAQATELREVPARLTTTTVSTGGMDWPPGVAGTLAQALFRLAIRPVKEVAIATALAILAGVCGRAWNTHTGAGLNLYIAFVGRSGVGKEGIADGVSKLMTATLRHGGMRAPEFFIFDSLASGPALIKQMDTTLCVLHISGEFGHDISFMAIDKTGPHASLRQQMTKLYAKSGASSVAGGISYSNRDNNVSINTSVSYSMIGETTPGTFYEALNGSMMADGFMSRFVIIEYDGQRPPQNEDRVEISKQCASWFAALTTEANSRPTPMTVTPDDDARDLYGEFDRECDGQINATDDEARRQMWNRAHLKALKVGALLAVADNHVVPKIALGHAQWAIGLVRQDIQGMTKRLNSGDVGDGDDTRHQKVKACLRDWLVNDLAETYRKRKGWPEMKQAGMVPRIYLTNRLQSLPLFANHRLGAVAAVNAVLEGMVRDGQIKPLERNRMTQDYGFHGDAYRIIGLD